MLKLRHTRNYSRILSNFIELLCFGASGSTVPKNVFLDFSTLSLVLNRDSAKTPDNVRLLKKAHFKARITAHFFQGRFTWYFQNIITGFFKFRIDILPFLNKGSMD